MPAPTTITGVSPTAPTAVIGTSSSSASGATPPPATGAGALGPFAAVFGGILAIGVVVTILIMRQTPAKPSPQASAPPPPAQDIGDGGGDSRGFPPGHPTVQIPKQALDFIKQIEQKAKANPSDLAAWDQLGDVALRAAAFDPSYYPKASDAYSHVLKIDPENVDALRGIGNIYFDQRKFDEAIAAYEHYLTKKPEDPDVRTDLGTMYLSTSNADQAVVQYKKVLAGHPQFFEAAFNLGVAYSQMNKPDDARIALQAARKMAPDGEARKRVDQMIASLNTPPATAPDIAGATGAPPPVASNVTTPTAGTFQESMEQMMRGLPIAGPKVQSLQWPSPTKARVLMDNFPMDQMPPFAAAKFTKSLKEGIDQAKAAHKIEGPVQVDICDAASGRVMQTVNE